MHIQRALGDDVRIVRLIDVAVAKQRYPFLELEYVHGGSLEDWIIEGNKLARDKVYQDKGEKLPTDGKPFPLSEAYVKEGGEIVDVQLVKGGVRLAQFLNDTFK